MGLSGIIAAPSVVRPKAVGIYIAHHGVRWDFFRAPPRFHGRRGVNCSIPARTTSSSGTKNLSRHPSTPFLVPELDFPDFRTRNNYLLGLGSLGFRSEIGVVGSRIQFRI